MVRMSRAADSSAQAMRIYYASLDLLKENAHTGLSNGPQGILSTALLVDILHGGAYARRINELPYYRKDRRRSPYWAGYIQHTTPTGLGTTIGSGLFGGVSTADIWQEIMVDANVPHVLPKVISDQAYAVFMLQFMQFTGTEIFSSAVSGVKTLVEAGEAAVETGQPQLTKEQLAQLLKLAAAKGKD